MKILFKISAILVALSLLLGITACGKNNDTPSTGNSYTLTLWVAQDDREMIEEMCNAYAAANPQNTYRFLFGIHGEGEVADKVLNDVQTGPDLYSFASDQINKLYAGGALARVGGSIEENIRQINTEGSIDAATLEINGEEHLYAYPSTGDNCYIVYYDKSVYTDPSDLESLDKMLDVAAEAGKTVHFRLNDDGWYLSSFFFADPELGYNVEYNPNMVETSVSINYDTPAGLEVMKSLRTYISRDNFVVQTDDSKIIAAFTTNKSTGKREAAAAISGTWNAETIKSLLGEDMGVCKLPTATIGGEEMQLSGYMGYKLIGVNGYSPNKGEAHKLAQWITNQENQMTRFLTRGAGPTNKTVAESDEVKSDPVIEAVMEQAEYNRAQKSVPNSYWTPMASLITPIITAKANGTEVTDEMLQNYLTALCKQIRK